MVNKALILAITIFLLLPSPALAQGKDNNSLLDRIKQILGPIEDTIAEFAALAETDYVGSAEDYWGLNWRSTQLTDQQFIQSTAPISYYNGAPAEIKDIGYTIEQLQTANTAQMSPMDYASWLGSMIAIPFQFVRGLSTMGQILGPLGIFLSWLFMAATWVTFVYFIEFMLKTLRSAFGIGSAILNLIGNIKP